jgi:PAS domain S-box-containing protein
MGEEEELTLERMVQYGLLDELADGLLVCDSEGAVVAVNRRICELSGYSADDLVGRPVDFLVPTAARDRHRRHRAEFARSGNPTRPMGAGLDTRLLTKDGGSRGVDIALSPLIIDDRELIVAAVRDAMARRRQEHLLASMREVTEAIMKSTPAVDIHRLICEQAAEMVGAAMALIAARSESENGYLVEASAGLSGQALEGAVLADPIAGEVGNEVWRIVPGRFSHLRMLVDRPLGPIAVFPVPEGQRQAFLVLARAEDEPAVGQKDLEALDTFSSQAGLAFAYGRRLRALAIAGDRDRIARDLHDLIIQRIFGAGLSLQATAQLFGDPELSRRLLEVVASLDTAISELRRSIFDLERKDQLDLRDRVLVAVEESLADYDLDSRVRVDEVTAEPPEDKVSHLIATLREALTNTGRHASASNVDISIDLGSELVLTIIDDGSGMSVDATMGHGLTNMAERARRLGGDLQVANSPEGGLEVVWRIPL